MSVLPRLVLLALMLGAPWVFGAVQPQWQFVMALVLGGLLVWRLVEALVGDDPLPLSLPAASYPALGLLVVATIQLLPRDRGLASRMEHAVFAEYASDVKDAESQRTGSLSPASTRYEAARLFFALSAFFLASQWFVTPPYSRWTCGALALNGAALGFFGIVQKLSWNGMLFWSVPLRHGGTPFASYVNRNNAAGYLNLCLAGALALALLTWGQFWLPQLRSRADRRMGLKARWLACVAQIEARHLFLAAMIGLITAAISFSLSRGGIVAMLVAALGVCLFALKGVSRWVLGGVLGLISLAAVGLLMWLGQWQEVDARLSTLSEPTAVVSGRWQHWQDTFGAVKDFPLLGTGLGTYRYANQPYQAHPAHAWYYNADNQFFEVLVETGVIGLLAFIAMLGLTGVAALRLLRRTEAGEARAIGVLGLFAVITQALQSVTDFGLLIPANGLVFAVISGTVCGMASHSPRLAPRAGVRSRSERSTLLQWDGRWAKVAFHGVLTAAAGLFLFEVHAATQTAVAVENAESSEEEPDQLLILDDKIREAQGALELRPDDPELHRALGHLWMARYRRVAYEAASAANPQAQPDELRQRAGIGYLFDLAVQFQHTEQTERLESLRALPAVQENLRPAWERFRRAQRLCPLARDVALQIAELSFITAAEDSADRFVRVGLFVAPSTPDRLFEAGVVADSLGAAGTAETAWTRCLAVSDEKTRDVWNAASLRRTGREVLDRVVPPRVEMLVKLAEEVSDEADRTLLVHSAAAALQNATDSEDTDEVPPIVHARLAVLQGANQRAIDWYRKALSENPLEFDWRLTLAQLLLDGKHYAQAKDEFSLLLHMGGNRKQIEGKLREVTRLLHQQRAESTRQPSQLDFPLQP